MVNLGGRLILKETVWQAYGDSMTNEANEDFDNLSREMFYTLIERNPLMATNYGIHECDHLMPEGTVEYQMENIRLLEDYLKKFEAIDPSGLTEDRKLDRGLAIHNLKLGLYHSKEIEMWRQAPLAASVVGSALFSLLTRDFAPLEKRLESITGRLERAPRYIEETKGRITDPVKLWTRMEIESCVHLPLLFDVIVNTGKENGLDEEKRKKLEDAAEGAKKAVNGYGEWLEKDVLPRAKEEYVVGRQHFENLLELRELDMSSGEILSLGEKYLRDTKEELERLGREIKPGAGVGEIKEEIKGKHPTSFEEAMKLYREAVEKSRKFVIENEMATVPLDEELRVMETPEYLRHVIPFAAYMSPAKFDKKQLGIYIVTPVGDRAEMMKEHSYSSITNTSVHEGYPGHHLQLTCALRNNSYIRLLSHSKETIEGWAHYCEEHMKNLGFDDTPESRFEYLTEIVWRACRIIIDIKLSSGEMSFDDAVEFLVKQTGMERPAAVAEVKRYTQYPAYQLSYLLGKHMIKELKEDVKRRAGEKYSDKFFHDTILYEGSIPMKYLRSVFDRKVERL